MIQETYLSVEMLQRGGGLPTWVWLLILLVIILIVVFALNWNTRKSGEDVAAHHEPAADAEPDDLTMIEGIGPKIASVFQSAGISTFAKLAESEVSELQKALDDASIRLGNPETWPQQAKLAAAGEWEALEKLQDELQGGRAA